MLVTEKKTDFIFIEEDNPRDFEIKLKKALDELNSDKSCSIWDVKYNTESFDGYVLRSALILFQY